MATRLYGIIINNRLCVVFLIYNLMFVSLVVPRWVFWFLLQAGCMEALTHAIMLNRYDHAA